MEALYVEVVKDGLSVSEMMKLLDQALSRELTQYDFSLGVSKNGAFTHGESMGFNDGHP
jgi:hypothetical protein